MKGQRPRLRPVVILLAVALFAPPAFGAEPTSALGDPRAMKFDPVTFTIPEVERIVMENGIIVYLLPDPELPLVNVSAMIRTGGVYEPADKVGLAALTGSQECVARVRATYQERRDVLVDGLRKLGLPVTPPRATFFVWAPVPDGSDSRKWASRLLQEAGVVVTPGVGFGPSGEGYYRIALTVDKARIAEAVARLGRLPLR